MEKKEYCGIFGVWGDPSAAVTAYYGLYALQHRGQESAGIATYDGKKFYVYKRMGLVADVFRHTAILDGLKGRSAIGHVRYSTTGLSAEKNAQPLLVTCKDGTIAVGHNGNLVNGRELRDELEKKGAIFQTTTDSEVMLHLIAHSRRGSLEKNILYAVKRLKGAFCIVMLTEMGLIAARDRNGFRPLSIGRMKNGAIVVASETCAFDLLDARFVRDVEPGEVVVINKGGITSHFPSGKAKKPSHCIFEHIYFARPDSKVFGRLVHDVRKRLGEELAKEHPCKADIVVPIPDSGMSAALGYSVQSGIPIDFGFIRNHYVGRTFIKPDHSDRATSAKIKLNIMPDVVKGRRVVVIDDSIVRGTTSQKRVAALKKAGAKEVHMRISCPPHRWPCFYGIDFPSKEELIANRMDMEEVRKFLGADSLGYLSMDGMLRAVGNGRHYCTACFSGRYPTAVNTSFNKFTLER